MSARRKLNQACVNACLLVAAAVGLVAQSWPAFLAALALGAGVAAAVGRRVRPGPLAVAAGALMIYAGASRLLEPLRAETDQPGRVRVLVRAPIGKVLVQHAVVPLVVVVIGALLAIAGCAAAGALPAPTGSRTAVATRRPGAPSSVRAETAPAASTAPTAAAAARARSGRGRRGRRCGGRSCCRCSGGVLVQACL